VNQSENKILSEAKAKQKRSKSENKILSEAKAKAKQNQES
jgi:hypothetical protein